MKKVIFTSLTALLVVFACQKKDTPLEPSLEESVVSQMDKRNCAAEEVLQQQMAADPTLRERMAELENFTRTSIATGKAGRVVNGFFEIDVVVNVLYNADAENISDAQIASQITVLNEDFQMMNADTKLVPEHFSTVKGSMAIRFILYDIIRKKTNKKSWGTNDAMKKSSMGGIDPTNPTTMLNMWSCNLGRNLLGYAQFPGGDPATDGIVILYSAFGSKAKAAGTYVGNYDLGRTATHEVGHWLNLRHIWGDATCGNDFVGDTPTHNTSNGGCPLADHRSTCTGTPLEQWMNYMDYTYDKCMYMFSKQQVDRMNAVFVAGGPRASYR